MLLSAASPTRCSLTEIPSSKASPITMKEQHHCSIIRQPDHHGEKGPRQPWSSSRPAVSRYPGSGSLLPSGRLPLLPLLRSQTPVPPFPLYPGGTARRSDRAMGHHGRHSRTVRSSCSSNKISNAHRKVIKIILKYNHFDNYTWHPCRRQNSINLPFAVQPSKPLNVP